MISLFGCRGGAGLFFVVVFLLLAIIGLVLFIFNYNAKSDPIPINVSVNQSFFNISLKTDAMYNVDYVLWYNNSEKVRGSIFSGALEVYTGGILNNSNVSFRLFGDKYYFSESVCNITYNDFKCFGHAVLKATDYQVSLNSNALFISLGEGVVQKPIFCFVETPRFLNVKMSFPEIKKPGDLKDKVDFCYQADTINFSVSFPFDVHFNDYISSPDVLKVVVRDFEISPYQNIGDKWAEIKI